MASRGLAAVPRRREAEIATETELKLAATPHHLPALTAAARDPCRRPGQQARLVTTYFDTPDGALARRG